MREQILVQGALLFSLLEARELAEWNYDDPTTWPETYETCGGHEQSPVNIPDPAAFSIEHFSDSPEFTFEYETSTTEFEFENLGTTVELIYSDAGLTLSEGAAYLPLLVGRSDDTNHGYTLEQAHFHWGQDRVHGSEHSVNAEFYPIELHLVHYNSGKYANMTEATGFEDGLLVVAVFFEVSDTDDTVDDKLEGLTAALTSDNFLADEQEDIEISLVDVLSSVDTTHYLAYPGSLTTPSCNEIVTWVIMKDTLKISEDTLEAFQQTRVSEDETIAPNYRHIQDGYARPVFDSDLNMYSVLNQVEDRNWNYSSFTQDMWTRVFPGCGGSAQSPIDLPLESEFVEPSDKPGVDFAFNYDVHMDEVEFENLGTTVELMYTDAGLKLDNGGAFLDLVGRQLTAGNNEFVVEQAHFHWGLVDGQGSEHTIGGKFYSMELHIVHYNTKYDNVTEAAGYADGLLVIGAFFEVDHDENAVTVDAALEPLKLVMSRRHDSFVEGADLGLHDFSLSDLMSFTDTSRYMAYPGSLTTPGCNEVVTWVLMRDILKISPEFMKSYRETNVKFGKSIANNFRHRQPGNERVVFQSPENTIALALTTGNETLATMYVKGDSGITDVETGAIGAVIGAFVVLLLVGVVASQRKQKASSSVEVKASI